MINYYISPIPACNLHTKCMRQVSPSQPFTWPNITFLFTRKKLEMLTIFTIKKFTLPHLFTLSIDAAVQRYLPYIYIYSPAKIDPTNNKIFTGCKMFTLPWTLTVSTFMVAQFTLTRKNQIRLPTLTPSSGIPICTVLLTNLMCFMVDWDRWYSFCYVSGKQYNVISLTFGCHFSFTKF